MVEVQIFPYACFFFSKTKYVLPTQLKIERGIPSGPWLRLYDPNAGGMGSSPGWGTKIPHDGMAK